MGTLRAWRKFTERDLGAVVADMDKLIEAPAVVLLTGEVGSGKTTWARAFVEKALGEAGEPAAVPSPTYPLVQEFDRVLHADLHRLPGGTGDVTYLELPLLLEDKDFFLVEWGRGHLRDLARVVPEPFRFYELAFEFCGNGDPALADKRSALLRDLGDEM